MNSKKCISLILMFVLLLSCGLLIACNNAKVVFKGAVANKTKEEYYLKFNYMDGRDSHNLLLQSGDVLDVHLEKEEGVISVLIGIEGEDYIYKTDDGGNMDFKLNIEKVGEYKITINSKKAKGVIDIKKVNS